MPCVRRKNFPAPLLAHLLDHIRKRNISANQLGLLADWLDTEPVVPDGKWFKKFSGMIVRGEGELIKTILRPGQLALGQEIVD